MWVMPDRRKPETLGFSRNYRHTTQASTEQSARKGVAKGGRDDRVGSDRARSMFPVRSWTTQVRRSVVRVSGTCSVHGDVTDKYNLTPDGQVGWSHRDHGSSHEANNTRP